MVKQKADVVSTTTGQFSKDDEQRDHFVHFFKISEICMKFGTQNAPPAGTGLPKCCSAPPTIAVPSTSGRWAQSWLRSTRSGHSFLVRQRSTRSSKSVLLSAHQTRYANKISRCEGSHIIGICSCLLFTGKLCHQRLPQYK